MSDSHRDPNESKQAWEDRLSEAALREVVGGEQPPDLTERIVAAAAAEGAEKMAEHKKKTTKSLPPTAPPIHTSVGRRRLAWLLATAAMLAVTSLLILPAITSLLILQHRNANNRQLASSIEDRMQKTAVDRGNQRRANNAADTEQFLRARGDASQTYEQARSIGDGGVGGGLGGGGVSRDRLHLQELSGFEGDGERLGRSGRSERNGRRGGQARRGEGQNPYEGYAARVPQPRSDPHAWEDLTKRRSKYAAEGGRREGGQAHDRGRREGGPARRGDRNDVNFYSQGHLEIPPPATRDRYAKIHENAFVPVKGAAAVSTFSIDVDTASYTNVRQYLMRSNQLPPPGAVRIEEMINYFDYSYEGPEGNSTAPFAAHIELARCPWKSNNLLARVALKGREIDSRERPVSNLVFLVDVSGSMNQPNKLPLVVDGLRQLTHELGENDRVAIVVYASAQGLALPSTPGTDKDTILGVFDRLNAGGSTAGGAGIELAYKIAQDNFVEGGVNRVILCTDGDFNVGVSDTAGLQRLAERKAQEANVFLTVLGYGRGNLNDEMMETISNKGNGNYHYIDNSREARKVLIEQMSGTLVTIAKDVKIQIEFNPAHVAAYRLIGYENRLLAREDFDDDKKDAGEIGAGHSVTALYELVPTGASAAAANSDAEPLKYQDEPATQPQGQPVAAKDDDRFDDELFTLRLRYKKPEENTSTKIQFVAKMNDTELPKASDDFRFAAAVASFGMLLRDSAHSGDATLESVLELAAAGRRNDPHGYRSEFVDMVRQAQQLCR